MDLSLQISFLTSVGYQLLTQANASSEVGLYSLTPSGGVADNYSFSYVNGQLNVKPLPNVTIQCNIGTSISKGVTVILSAAGGDSYVWSTANGIIGAQNGAQLTIRPSESRC